MKLVRYGEAGSEKPGLIDASGAIRDLSGVVRDIDGSVLGDESLARLRAIDPSTLPRVDGSPRFGAPVAGSSKFIAIGLNYSDHAKESNMPIPKEPVVFSKATSCISGPNDTIVLPKGSVKGDWEVELAFVIGKTAKAVSEADALDHVAGYMICNASGSSSADRPGTRARVSTPLARWAPGWSRATRSPTLRTSPCGSTSTASACRPATPTP